jgi:DNA-binding MarR family transcriptional regulator
VQALLELLAGEMWLERQGEAYYLTEAGKKRIHETRDRLEPYLDDVTAHLLKEETKRLVTLLDKTIELSLQHDGSVWCLEHSRNRAPGADAHPIRQIIQYFDDWNAFRDDAHMAAFQPLEERGHAWEAFSHIWDGSASTATGVFETLVYRGFSLEEYTHALDSLVERRWLSKDGDVYTMTEEGQQIRQRVEDATNAYFYKPWEALSAEEIDELERLLTSLRDRCNALAKPV